MDRPRRAPSDQAGIIASWALLGLAAFLLFMGREHRGAGTSERAAGGTVETTRTVARVEEDVSEKLARWDVPRSGTDRPLRMVVSDVRWADAGGSRWLTVARVSASVRAGVLTGGAIVLESVDVASPVVRLQQFPSGRWNVAGIFESDPRGRADNGARRGSGAGVELRDVRIRNGRLALDMPERGYEFSRVSAVVPVAQFGGRSRSGPFVRLASLDASVAGAIPGPAQSLSVRQATLGGRRDGIEFAVARLALDESVMTDIEGVLSSALPDPGLRARGRAPTVQFADVHRLLPEFPESGVASFDWSVDPLGGGRLSVRLNDMDLVSGESRVAGSTTVIVGGETFELGPVDVRLDPLDLAFLEEIVGPLPYSGLLRGRVTGSGERLSFDVSTALLAEGIDAPIDTRVEGVITLRGLTPTIERVTAHLETVPLAALRAVVPGLPLRGIVSGSVSFAGMPGDGPLHIDATIALPQGNVDLEGAVRLGAVPSYDLTGTLNAVRLRELLAFDVPPVLLDARFTLAGTGTDPATADARLSLSGRFSGWQAGPADLIVVDAAVAGGVLDIDRAAARLATLDARVEGEWRLVAPATGGLRYSVEVASLEPFGPYLPGPADYGSGALSASGTVAGALDRIAFTSEVSAQELRYGAYSARSLAGSIDYAAGDSLPRIDLEAEAEGVVTPNFGEYQEASAAFVLDAQRFTGELTALRPGGGVVEVQADGRVGGPRDSDLVLRNAIIDLGRERWQLTHSAAIELREDGLRVDTFVVTQVDGPGRLSLSGQLLPLERADFRYDLRALPVGEIQRLLGRDPLVTGRLWSQGRFESLDAPTFELEFRVEDAVAMGVPILRLEGTTRYGERGLHVVASGAVSDTAGTLEADITFPLVLAVRDSMSFGMNESGRVSGRLRVDRFPVAVVAPFTDAVTEPGGSISGSIRIDGTVETPRLDGSLSLSEVALTIPALDRRFERIGGRIEFAERRAELVDVIVHSGGTAELSGSVVFQELDDPALDIVARLDEFEALGAKDEDPAELSGAVTLRGPLSAPTIAGRVGVDNGTIDVPTGGEVDPFTEAELGLLDQSTFGVENLPGARPPAFGDLTVRGLVVDIGSDVWLATPEARARLGGELTVFHDFGETRIFGTLQGNRGTFTLRAGPVVRRFEIRDASIRFFGTGDLNPALDITATRTMGALEEPLELVVHVTGTLERPAVSLATGDGVPVPESELLSVLVFGRPSFTTATQSTEAAFGALLALGGITDLASARLQEALAEDAGLPIDYVQLRASGNDVTQNVLQNLSIALGTELYWDDVFLTVDFPPADPERVAAAVQWRIDREWSLQIEYEPIIRRGAFTGIGFDEILGTQGPTRQFGVEIRRRWTY